MKHLNIRTLRDSLLNLEPVQFNVSECLDVAFFLITLHSVSRILEIISVDSKSASPLTPVRVCSWTPVSISRRLYRQLFFPAL